MIRHKAAQKRLSISALAIAQQLLEQQQELEIKQNQEKEKEKGKGQGQEGEGDEELPVAPVEVVDKPSRKVLNATGIKYTSLVSNIYIHLFFAISHVA